jgi:hypothetical protein
LIKDGGEPGGEKSLSENGLWRKPEEKKQRRRDAVQLKREEWRIEF